MNQKRRRVVPAKRPDGWVVYAEGGIVLGPYPSAEKAIEEYHIMVGVWRRNEQVARRLAPGIAW